MGLSGGLAQKDLTHILGGVHSHTMQCLLPSRVYRLACARCASAARAMGWRDQSRARPPGRVTGAGSAR